MALPVGEAVGEIEGRLARVLVISDDLEWCEAVGALLRAEWFDVAVDDAGILPADAAARFGADVVLVDLGLRARSAVAVCVELRGRSHTPILAMGSTTEGPEVLAAFAAGADSHAVVTGRPRELVARVRALLRRFPPRPIGHRVLQHGPVQIDLLTQQVRVAGTPITLSPPEYELLQAFLWRPGHVGTRRELLALLPSWGSDERVLDLHVRRLRDKVEALDTRRRILTVRGVGFRFDAEDDADEADMAGAGAAS